MDHDVATWPAVRQLDTEYRALLGATVDALGDAGARIDNAHPPGY